MNSRSVGRTGIRVSEIGFGCWTMGGPNWDPQTGQQIGWADVDEDDVLAGIRAGLDAGVNHFDNADVYGNGRAERLLRDCLDRLGLLRGAGRDGLVIATKVGHMRGAAEHAFEPHHIRRQCEQSLRNLGVDHIDIYYFHHGSFAPDGRPGNLHDAAGEMRRLVDEGKVRAVGQSAYSDDDFERAVPVVRPDVLQSWANMLDDRFIRRGSRLQALMDRFGCSFVAFSPLAQGLLLDKFDPDNPPKFDAGDNRNRQPEKFTPDALRALRFKLAQIKTRFGDTPEDPTAGLASVACRYVLAHPNVCSVIPGFRNERQARANVRAASDPAFTDSDAEFCRQVLS